MDVATDGGAFPPDIGKPALVLLLGHQVVEFPRIGDTERVTEKEYAGTGRGITYLITVRSLVY